MENSEGVATVFIYSALAAATAVLGVLPFLFTKRLSEHPIGIASAAASGLMLGAGYLLISNALVQGPGVAILGASLGFLYTFWSRRYSEVEELDGGGRETLPDEVQGYRIILQNALHAASEGVAIGVAMALNLRLGIFMALALAIHNIGEAMALTSLLRERRVSLGESAGLCVVTNLPQVLLAVFTFSIAPLLGAAFPAALGFASGALVFLVLTEVLPASYRRTERSAVASAVSLTAGTVVLLESFFV